MAVLSPPDARPLAEQSVLSMAIGGAESNVACGLAGLGHRAAWLSRPGDDPFARRILAELTARGVDVSAVETDPERPTGVYFKDPGPDHTRTHYYRGGSAASRMGPELARRPALHQARVVHVSGVAAALSDSCARLLEAILVGRNGRVPGGPVVSFDVNHRPALWQDGSATAARSLLALARAADIVFVGRDEAEALWGTARPDDIAGLLGPAPVVVVKDAEHGATSYVGGVPTFVPSLPPRWSNRSARVTRSPPVTWPACWRTATNAPGCASATWRPPRRCGRGTTCPSCRRARRPTVASPSTTAPGSPWHLAEGI